MHGLLKRGGFQNFPEEVVAKAVLGWRQSLIPTRRKHGVVTYYRLGQFVKETISETTTTEKRITITTTRRSSGLEKLPLIGAFKARSVGNTELLIFVAAQTASGLRPGEWFDIAWGMRKVDEHGGDLETQRLIRLAKCERAIRRLFRAGKLLPFHEQHQFQR
jgi:hypothetical protein